MICQAIENSIFIELVDRDGRKDVAINLVRIEDTKILRELEQDYSTQIDEMPLN